MGEAARRLAVYDEADADASADRDVGEVIKALPRTPPHFGHRRAVHIGVEDCGDARGATQRPEDVSSAPARLGRARDLTMGGRRRIEVQRAKAADAECGETVLSPPA